MAKESLEINPAGIRLSKNQDTPLYVQVYEQFREMNVSKRLRPGDRVPGSRNLAKELGVSRVIVHQGYEQLILEGYLVGRTGAGTFVASTLPDQLLNAARPGKNAGKQVDGLRSEGARKKEGTGKNEIKSFQIGTPSLDQFPYKAWGQVAGRVLKEVKGVMRGYEYKMGHWGLREAIAAYVRMARAVNCEAEQVVIVTGSLQGLNLVIKCLLKKGDKVWMEDPGYSGARKSFLYAGAQLCPIPIEADGMNITYGQRKAGDAKLAYVTPSHQFPLGCTLSQDKRLQLLEWAGQNKMWILEDDYDSEFRYEGRPLASLQGLDKEGRVIYSGTFSKVLFPGLRLAYIVLPSVEMLPAFKKVKEIIDRQSPIMEQLILSRFIEEGYFLRHIRKMRLLYADRQRILAGLLDEQARDYFQVSAAPSGMHLLCRLSDKIEEVSFRQELERQQLVIAFIADYTIESKQAHAILLGFTAFTKYKMKT